MTVEPGPSRAAAPPAHWLEQFGAWRCSATYLYATDMLVVLTAASLPWSTTAPTVFILLWLFLVLPLMDWKAFGGSLLHPTAALPLAFFALATIGTLWSDAAWAARLHGINPVSKLLLIPFLLYFFQRSRRGLWILIAFLASCALLLLLSWIVLFDPALKIAATVSDGVPVKNYIDQSQEFALCIFALAYPALVAARERRLPTLLGHLVLILAFLANMLFVVSARTALIYMPVLLVMFAARYLDRRTAHALLAAIIAAGLLVWTTSPYLRKRIGDITIEYQAYETNTLASTAQRLTYWRKSIGFIARAPLLGHGTGSIGYLFEQDAIGKTGLRADVVNNPHNQTLNAAVQWGLLGVIVLYAMWLSHLLLFSGRDLATWIGLVVVVQNLVSSLLNSHLFDFHEGWMYVLGVGIAGGLSLRDRSYTSQPNLSARSTHSEVNGSPRARPHR
ncbi:O-antigen ligase family protein [Bradyrhizobium sp. ARR65]|uniref:O-antigen ligase family protein n=1 Tax=Bradyrhizobium sp. ARR65 TaxID=1040989 RepID=UPI000465AEA0|nr:O-antigen ligase family protein [Bradyrhizobium sp. ARR65]